jgi:hypothetical protein
MKRNEIRTKVRYNIRESTPEIWADAELNYWIDDVQREVANRLHHIYNPKLVQMHSASAASGTANYDLPTRYLDILGNADLNDETYVVTPINLVRPTVLGEFAYDSSKKIIYIQNNDFYLWPTPGSSENNELVRFPFLKGASDFADDATTDGDLGEVGYNLVVDKVSGLALLKVNSDESQRLAQGFLSKYESDLEKLNKVAKK